MCSVRGAQFHVAPADVDVGAGVVWLPRTAFTQGDDDGRKKDEEEEANSKAKKGEEERQQSEDGSSYDDGSSLDGSSVDDKEMHGDRGGFSLEAALLEGETFFQGEELKGGSKFGTFLPIFCHDDKDSFNSFEIDALIFHTNLMPAALVRGEAAKFNFSCDQQQLGILGSFIKGFGGAGNDRDRRKEREESTNSPSTPKAFVANGSDEIDNLVQIWERRQELSWEAKKLLNLKKSLEGMKRQRGDLILSVIQEELLDSVSRIEAEGAECLNYLEDRVSNFTLKLRQLEVRPNLQLFLEVPEIVVELKVREEDNGVGGRGRRDPFIRVRLSQLGLRISSYERGHFSVQVGLHSLKIVGFERIHEAAELKEVPMVTGFDYAYSNKVRNNYGINSGRVSRLPPEWDEDGTTDMIAMLLVVGEGGESSADWEFLVRHFELNIVPLVIQIRKGQVTGLIDFFAGGGVVGVRPRALVLVRVYV